MASTQRASSGNWQRWGEKDERGAANFIDDEQRVAAARLVRTGRVYSLALPLRGDTLPSSPLRGRMQHFMTIDGGDFAAGVRLKGDYQCADDWLSMPSQVGTHIDGLAHVWYDDRLYNGHAASSVRSYGATRCGIENLEHLVTRGILLDVAALLGVEHLPAEHVITPEELERAAKRAGVELRPGDVVLIRTGWYRVFASDRERYDAAQPGIGLAAARWLASREVAAVGADNLAIEATVGADGFENGDTSSAVHKLLLRDHGIYLIELLDLERLAADRVSEFLFVVAPLPIVGGVGSPLNPLAIV